MIASLLSFILMAFPAPPPGAAGWTLPDYGIAQNDKPVPRVEWVTSIPFDQPDADWPQALGAAEFPVGAVLEMPSWAWEVSQEWYVQVWWRRPDTDTEVWIDLIPTYTEIVTNDYRRIWWAGVADWSGYAALPAGDAILLDLFAYVPPYSAVGTWARGWAAPDPGTGICMALGALMLLSRRRNYELRKGARD